MTKATDLIKRDQAWLDASEATENFARLSAAIEDFAGVWIKEAAQYRRCPWRYEPLHYYRSACHRARRRAQRKRLANKRTAPDLREALEQERT